MSGWLSDGTGSPSVQGGRQANPPAIKPQALRDAASTDKADQLILSCREKLLSDEGVRTVL